MTGVRLYTVLLDYAGGTYIAQVSASSPRAALTKWARSVPDNLKLIVGPDACWAIKTGFEGDLSVSRVKGVRGVWCSSALAGEELALVHLIATDTGPAN